MSQRLLWIQENTVAGSSCSRVAGNGAYGSAMLPNCTSGASCVDHATVSPSSSSVTQRRTARMCRAEPGTTGSPLPVAPPDASIRTRGLPKANGNAK